MVVSGNQLMDSGEGTAIRLRGRTLVIRSGQDPSEFTDKLHCFHPHLEVRPRLHVYTSLSNPECIAKKPATFAATVIQKTATKLGLEHL